MHELVQSYQAMSHDSPPKESLINGIPQEREEPSIQEILWENLDDIRGIIERRMHYLRSEARYFVSA